MHFSKMIVNLYSNTKLHFIKNKTLRISLIILFILLLLAGTAFGLVNYQLNKVTITTISKVDEELGIGTTISDEPDTPKVEMDEDIVNIALLGNDRRAKEEVGRTDAIMILTIDKKHKKIKLSSIMRDTFVTIDGSRRDKITNTFMRGGAQLTIKTINENFKLDIRDYVLVDFFSLEKIIDSMGGVTMDIKKAEIPDLNFYIQEVADLEGVAAPLFAAPGPQLLNGMQAVSYARIRHTGNGDYERTERQRRVLAAIFEKIKAEGPLKYPGLVAQILPYTETSLDKSAMFKLGAQVFAAGITNLEQQRFPLDKASQGITINGGWYLWADIKATAQHIHTFIYDDMVPEVLPGDKIEQPPQPSPPPKVEVKPQPQEPQPQQPAADPNANTNTSTNTNVITTPVPIQNPVDSSPVKQPAPESQKPSTEPGTVNNTKPSIEEKITPVEPAKQQEATKQEQQPQPNLSKN